VIGMTTTNAELKARKVAELKPLRDTILKMKVGREYTVNDIMLRTGKSKRTIERHLNKLAKMQFISVCRVSAGRHSEKIYSRLK